MTHHRNDQTSRAGLLNALAAFGMWGLVPIYFKAVASVGALEVLAHRVIWSVLFLALIIGLSNRWQSFRRLLQTPRLLFLLLLSAVLIAINWLVFIWAVADGRILETSLGYFISPLVSVFLGVLFLGERLRSTQWLAVGLAGLGVLWELWQVGYLPWVALSLSGSFGLYGLLRKKIAVDATLGLSVETLVLLPAALAYLVWLANSGEMHFVSAGASISWLLAAAGLVTSLPLICYAAAANRLDLSVLGLVQYLTPSITFFLGVFVYNEPFDSGKLVTFSLIWLALIIFTADSWRFRARAW